MRTAGVVRSRPRAAFALLKGAVRGCVSAVAPRRGMGSEARRNADFVQLDPVIHEQTRLGILTVLYTAPGGHSFSDLRDTLALTDGNLMAHLRTLETAGLVERLKEGAGRASSTTVQLGAPGRKAFKNYLDQLETLVRAARSAPPAHAPKRDNGGANRKPQA